jgi:tripartite-type tricarboxylate transporter receptor subunit TctC
LGGSWRQKWANCWDSSSWWRTEAAPEETSALRPVAKASPDGYTILMATVSTNAINPGLYTHMSYDAIRDFAPLGRIGVTPTLLLVNPSIPASDVKSLIALIKANPGKYNYGSSGVGSILHLCGEEFKALAGDLEITHVPYKGSAPMDTDLLGGQIAMAFDATPTAMPLAKSGKLRALGAGMAKRLPAMPDLPTLQEQGLKGYECYFVDGCVELIDDRLWRAGRREQSVPGATSLPCPWPGKRRQIRLRTGFLPGHRCR